MSLLEAAVMTLAIMLLVLMGILFVCLGYAVWMLAISVWVRVLLEAAACSSACSPRSYCRRSSWMRCCDDPVHPR